MRKLYATITLFTLAFIVLAATLTASEREEPLGKKSRLGWSAEVEPQVIECGETSQKCRVAIASSDREIGRPNTRQKRSNVVRPK
jgi:hypothetical protein